jgi:hypothetical protein
MQKNVEENKETPLNITKIIFTKVITQGSAKYFVNVWLHISKGSVFKRRGNPTSLRIPSSHCCRLHAKYLWRRSYRMRTAHGFSQPGATFLSKVS